MCTKTVILKFSIIFSSFGASATLWKWTVIFLTLWFTFYYVSFHFHILNYQGRHSRMIGSPNAFRGLQVGSVNQSINQSMQFLFWWVILKNSDMPVNNIQINTVRQSITQYLFYIQCYICQGHTFRPSRSSSDPPRKQTQELFSLSALWDLCGEPEDDRLGRNLSPWHIYHCI
jgi:hypothetical protein